MPTADLAVTPATDLAVLIPGQSLCPVELMRTTLERIERSQRVPNALITIAADSAMAAAREAEAAPIRVGACTVCRSR